MLTLAQAINAAGAADAAWQAALDAQRIDRWSTRARGEAGSRLRALYDAKAAADQAMAEAFAFSRAA